MYLRSLEVQGFKSFPDKTVLQFGSDITAIVGPNGSGKSNISDAISWVLGEQSSKALRGAKMEDVIFGGTQKRAAVGYAEATLVLDNQAGQLRIETPEVAITRRYYRSGESEYFINRQSARLRDINELLMDTGLGKEGYSNIGQGKVDEILALKSTDRREVFEEAAGISKYRHRKEETERRLANTEDNLLRIGDKISELELQVEPLREQAEKAKKYLALRDELKGLEVTVWLDGLGKAAEHAKKAETDYASAAFILEQAHDELNALYHQAEQMALQLNQKSLELDLLREKITEKYPGAVIAGMYSPPFRPLTADEDAEIVEKINAAKPDFVWVGLGAPKQERWMAAHENRVQALMLGVGAAFDYEAGNIRRAPAWMQRCNLEWLYRLMQDPKRLFKRYFVTNTKFLWWSWRH